MSKDVKSLVSFLPKYKDLLGENDYQFLNRVFAEGLDTYRSRLKAIGFEKMGKVLDIGCGFGQWSLALAEMNKDVFAGDISSMRLLILNDILEELKIKNIRTSQETLEKTRFKSNTFDAVFCYGAIFIANPQLALKEFYRILKPGGKLYVTANGLGWTLQLWVNSPNAVSNYDPKLNVAKAFMNTVNFNKGIAVQDGQVIIEKEEMIRMMQTCGFKQMKIDGEGKLNVSKDKKLNAKSFFKEDYFGFTGVYEILATK